MTDQIRLESEGAREGARGDTRRGNDRGADAGDAKVARGEGLGGGKGSPSDGRPAGDDGVSGDGARAAGDKDGGVGHASGAGEAALETAESKARVVGVLLRRSGQTSSLRQVRVVTCTHAVVAHQQLLTCDTIR